ncbi:MAG: hypothetical protein ACI4VF_03865 [Lachnospirales bacterium]
MVGGVFCGAFDGGNYGVVNIISVICTIDKYNKTMKKLKLLNMKKIQKLNVKDENMLFFIIDRIKYISPKAVNDMVKYYCENVPKDKQNKRQEISLVVFDMNKDKIIKSVEYL